MPVPSYIPPYQPIYSLETHIQASGLNLDLQKAWDNVFWNDYTGDEEHITILTLQTMIK